MKKILILLLLMAMCGPLSAQTKHEVHDFYSLMTAIPMDEDSSVISLKNTDSMVVVKRYPLGNISEFYLKSFERIGPDIDKLDIIDYKSDTVFISDFEDFYFQYILVIAKADSIAFNLDTKPVEFSKVEFPEYMDFDIFFESEYFLKRSLFDIFADWSEDKFIELIEKYRCGYILSKSDNDILIRFIIKDGLLIRKDLYYYEPILILNAEVFEYWQTHILPNKE